MVACSASFLTPISFQTNLMVMGPGRYEFLDFLRFGFGLQIVTMVTTAVADAAALGIPLFALVFSVQNGETGERIIDGAGQ